MDYISKVKELSTYTAVPGYEKELSHNIKKMFEKYCQSVEIDDFYNVIGIKKGSGMENKKIMITAHIDEIGFMVKSIDERGFIKLSNLGGIDSKILLSQEVIIHGKKKITGIIGAKPPHLLKAEEAKKSVKIDQLSVDTGMDEKTIREFVSIGDIVSFKAEPFALKGNKVSGKTMDNRCGLMALLVIIEELAKIRHEDDIYIVATTQEEVGTRGAIIASYNVQPDIAVVIDACHGDTPDAPKRVNTALGKGPAIGVGPNLHKGITKKIMEIAKDVNIPFQIDVEPGDTGTEAWATQVSRSGIPTILLSIPVRYMHTTIETVNIDDIKNTGRLAAEFIARFDSGREGLLCC
jgi:tetrahedral aminopeptidase